MDKAEVVKEKKPEILRPRRFTRLLLIIAAGLILFCALITFLFDPFYHYHKPWFHMKAVLNEKEYQVIGTLRNFDYDAVLVGSSVVENTDNGDVDNAFGCTTIKAVRSYGGIADLCWFLDAAHEKHEINQVFFNIDPSSLSAEPEQTFKSSGCPMYLYDRNPFNDINYLANRDVLFKRIPYEIAQSFSGYYDEGKSYNWSADKDFSEDGMLYHYLRTPSVMEMQPEDMWEWECTGNIALLVNEVESHPETYYRFFFPPYSMLWWDNSIRTGERDAVLKNELRTMNALIGYKNVEIYNYQDVEEIVTDLNNYMDTLHFSPVINRQIIDDMAAGIGRVEKGEQEKRIAEIRAFSDSLQKRYMDDLGASGRFKYGLPDE